MNWLKFVKMIVAMIGTNDQYRQLAEACKILLLFCFFSGG